MKRIIHLFIIFTFYSFSLAAQDYIDFQITVSGNDGQPYVNKDVTIKLNILQGSESGDNIYTETHLSKTDSKGIINLKIGSGKAEKGDFESIQWDKNKHFVAIAIDREAGTNYQSIGVAELNYQDGSQSNESYSINLENITTNEQAP